MNKIGKLMLAAWLLTPLVSLGANDSPALDQSRLALNDDEYQIDDTGYVADLQTKTDTYFEDDVQQLSYRNKEHRQATGHSVFVFSPKQLRWFAYNGKGELVGSGKASGGRNFCPDLHRRCHTPVGTFSIHSMGDGSCYSTKFPVGKGGAPMPYCMFFKGGYAIHGSYHVPNYNASHGCIRLVPSAARWLRYNVLRVGSTVVVQSY